MPTPRAVPIAFAFPPGVRASEFAPHLGVAYLRASLAARGVASRQVLLPRGARTLERCVDRLLAARSPILGFSCYDTNYFLVRLLARRLKRRRPGLILLAGGPSATFAADLVLGYAPELDVAVHFDAEETVYDLVRHFEGGGRAAELDAIAGVTFRRGGELVRTPDRPLPGLGAGPRASCLDVLPSPYLTGLLTGAEEAGVITSRGCPHRCTYCNFAAMGRGAVRYHSVDRVVEELCWIGAHRRRRSAPPGADLPIQIQDDAFTLNPGRAKEICRRLAAEQVGVRLSALCRADHLDEELVALMQDAGFDEVAFGLESAVPRVLRTIQKVCSRPAAPDDDFQPERRFLARVEAAVAMAKARGMKTMVSIILGLPGETREDALATIDFVRRLGVDRYAHNYLVVHRGTEIHRRRHRYGIRCTTPPTGLPLRTIHDFPVREIPILPHADTFRDDEPFARASLRFVSGVADAGAKPIQPRVRSSMRLLAGGGGPSGHRRGAAIERVLLRIGDDTPLARTLDWLRETLAVSAHVLVLDARTGASPAAEQALRERIAAAGLPVCRCFFLRRSRAEDGGAVLALDPDMRPFGRPFELRAVPFAAWAERLDAETAGDADAPRLPVLLVDDRRDLDLLRGLCEQAEAAGAPPPALDGVFADGCRWGRARCPAARLERLVIDPEGRLRPCLGGGPIGDGGPPAALRARMRAIQRRTWRRRGCAACPVRDRCARCPFPGSLTDEEYCTTRRRHPGIAKIVLATNLCSTL